MLGLNSATSMEGVEIQTHALEVMTSKLIVSTDSDMTVPLNHGEMSTKIHFETSQKDIINDEETFDTDAQFGMQI